MTMTCIERQPLLADRFHVVEILRESTVAQVITADDLNTGNRVLIKLYEPQSQSAYRREAAVVLALSHPQIVNCLETFYLPSGQACLVYEYLPHGSLQTFITNHLISHTQLLWLLADILSGLAFLHDAGFVHCDLKPDNILIRHDIAHNRIHAVIADLGSATPLKEARLGRHRIGSPAYTAPERLYEGFSLNSDLYSLGIMAFQLYTGQLPFIGSVQDIYRAHLAQSPALSEIYDRKIRDLIGMLLEKKPHQRIATADQALEIVRHMLLAQSEQSEQSYTAGAETTEDTAVAVPHRPQAIRHLRSGVLEQVPEQLFVFGNTPWLGVSHGHAIQFVDITGAINGPIQLSHGPFLPQQDGSILFPTEDSVQCCYPASRTYRLDILCKGATALCVQQDHIAVMDSRQLLIYHRDGKLQASVIARNYALEPVLCSHPQGGFLASSGMANHELRWIGIDGTVQQTWNLGGPILAVTGSGAHILVAGVALDEPSMIQFWRLEEDTQHGLREPVSHGVIFAVNGYLLWLRNSGEMMVMDGAMTPYGLGTLSPDARLKAVSPRLDFFAVTTKQTARHYEIWQLESAAGEQI